ncbi:MAG: hypothetical protein PHI90_03240 [Clostridia bacterium]|nr:hypothetical protein [Clostridia bacterium]MDD4047832.1 hypothetical protein [Clostridia bacterium]
MKELSAFNYNHINVAYNLSGAVEAVKMGRFVVLVDIIDMSTSFEAVSEAGAYSLWGASPSEKDLPYVNPFLIGKKAAQEAKEKATGLIIIAEPRNGSNNERKKRAIKVINGVESEGIQVEAIVPNLGAETAKILDWEDKVVIAVTDCGGVIFDAVYQLGGKLTTATVARTIKTKGIDVALKGINRTMLMANNLPITFVAASSNALEDVLAVHYLAQLMIQEN